MMSALFLSEFYTRMKRYWSENIYLFTACANCYLWLWGKVIFKTGNIPSTWSWLNAVVRFECDKSAIDVIINFCMKNIPQANRTCGFEISTGQTKKSLAVGHRTTVNFEHWFYDFILINWTIGNKYKIIVTFLKLCDCILKEITLIVSILYMHSKSTEVVFSGYSGFLYQ